MESNELLKEVLKVMSRWSPKGEKLLSTGVRLICPTPHVAPEAWLHVVYPPTRRENVSRVETQLGVVLPDDYKAFLLRANGLEMFSYRLSVWGIRTDMARTGDEAWQPYDLVNLNYETDRPEGTPRNIVYFGSVDRGETLCFFDFQDGNYRVGRTDRQSYEPNSYSPDFAMWLLDEVRSLQVLFDSDGALITNS